MPAQEVSVLPRVEARFEARVSADDDSVSGPWSRTHTTGGRRRTYTGATPSTVQTVAVVH